jgi:hypothetical protein
MILVYLIFRLIDFFYSIQVSFLIIREIKDKIVTNLNSNNLVRRFKSLQKGLAFHEHRRKGIGIS